MCVGGGGGGDGACSGVAVPAFDFAQGDQGRGRRVVSTQRSRSTDEGRVGARACVKEGGRLVAGLK